MKKMIKTALAAAVLPMLVACGGEEASSGKVELTLGTWASSPEESALVDRQVALFEKANPGIKVNRQVGIGDYMQELQSQFAAGMEPDVFYVDIADISSLIEREAVLPLDEYLTESSKAAFQPRLLNAFQQDGKTYGLPKDYNPLVMFYNKDMLAAVGAEAPANWSELEETAQKLVDASKQGGLNNNFLKPLAIFNDGNRNAVFMMQNGGSVYDAETQKLTFNSAEAKEGMQFVYDMVEKGFADTPNNLGETSLGDSFAREKVAMIYSGGWEIPYLAQAAPNVNYGLAMLPKGKHQATMMYTVSYSMGRNTKHPEEAAKLIEFLTAEAAQKLSVESGLGLPTLTSLGDSFKDLYPERGAMIDMADHVTPFNFGLYTRRVDERLTTAGERVYLKRATASEALDQAYLELK